MKYFIAVIALLTSTSGYASNRATCALKIQYAELNLKAEEGAASNGTGSNFPNLLSARLGVEQTKLDCHAITIDSYCQAILSIAQQIVDYAQAMMGNGMGTILDVKMAQVKQAELTSFCE